VPADAGRGLSARHVSIALAVLLAILVGVVFVLPDAVEEERVTPAGEPAAAGEPDDGPAAAADGSPRRPPERDERVQARSATEQVLGELLSKMETLESRAVQRWGGLAFKQAQSAYAAGDAAFLDRDYDGAAARYREAIDIVDPLLDEVDEVFARAYDAGLAALEAADTREALRQLELAAAVSPGHAGARAALSRARNLETVLALTDQGLRLENELELEAARQSFADAVDLDPDWEPAQEGLVRVREAIRQRDFDQRMTEGLAALEAQDFVAARAAFRMAKQLRPDSPEPADGLLQVDQGIRLARIAALERQATAEARAEEWETAAETYESILEIDSNLQFAQEGLADARRMAALHAQLDEFIAEPDSLSAPATMARATRLVVDITRMPEIGPRLGDRRDQLSRLLKRAATPLTVTLVSDNVTEVSIYKVGKLGSFESRDVELRPGTYVAVGSRPGYRDVRLEFRVAPELDLDPIVVRCEETI
jgi:tetratricopeptide (TPR) repeat protein